jgi:hypothetical protein
LIAGFLSVFKGSDPFSSSAGFKPSFVGTGLAAQTHSQFEPRKMKKAIEIKARRPIFDLISPAMQK